MNNFQAISAEILQAARVLFQPGDLVELRVPKARRQRTVSGYFSDLEKLAKAAAQLEQQKYPGVYWTLNPVNPELLARAENKTVPFAESTTSDGDIVCRRWLPVDLDPKRPAGISSSAPEHQAALVLAEKVKFELGAEGWPEPVYADSGNGTHLLYRVDLPNDAESADLLKRILQALAFRFSSVDQGIAVDVDLTTFNASRIFKVYGTTARKGDSTTERPHRGSCLLHVPEALQPVSLDLLKAMAAHAPAPAAQQQRRTYPMPRHGSGPLPQFDLPGFLSRFGVRYRDPVPYHGGLKYVLIECPFDPSHKAPDAMVYSGSDGLGFKCLHNSCIDRHWQEFRELFEGPRESRGPRLVQPAPRWPDDAPLPEPPPDLVAPVEGAAAVEAPPAGDVRDEIPLSAADVEAAVKAACDAGDLEAAMRLIPDIAKVPLYSYTLIHSLLRKKFKRDFPVRDFARAVRELQEKRNAPPAADEDDLPAEDAPDLIGTPFIPLTDSGNGERIVKLFGEDIRFCSEFKKWLLWDGRRWLVDTDAATVTQRAKTMARLLYQQATRLEDPVMQKAVKAHARDSESQGAISAALLRAKSEPGMSISAAQLDQHRYLLNCLNGVVDVRTGELLGFERRYYITKLVHVNYRPESNAEKDCPRFLKYLHWAMGETPDMAELPERVVRMVGFLQKSIGYALTGDVSEKAAFIFYGAKGNNGKTTLLTIFKTILVEYSCQLDINTLMTSKFTDNNVRADLAKLHGARFVITSEVDDGQRLSERLMKYLTAGMGEITACRKFENPFEFTATHKLFMDCNYRPEVKGADEAIWSRLKCVPFLQRISKGDPDLDKQLLNKILAESEGVLAWAVRGAMRWAKDSDLGDPPEVEAAGAEWRDADDPLKPFFEECCDIHADYWVRCSDFTKAYQQWCRDNNEQQLKSSRLTQRLELKGIKLNRSRRVSDAGKQARCWDGLKLRTDVTCVPGASDPVQGIADDF